jgi:hypothetical protein
LLAPCNLFSFLVNIPKYLALILSVRYDMFDTVLLKKMLEYIKKKKSIAEAAMPMTSRHVTDMILYFMG